MHHYLHPTSLLFTAIHLGAKNIANEPVIFFGRTVEFMVWGNHMWLQIRTVSNVPYKRLCNDKRYFRVSMNHLWNWSLFWHMWHTEIFFRNQITQSVILSEWYENNPRDRHILTPVSLYLKCCSHTQCSSITDIPGMCLDIYNVTTTQVYGRVVYYKVFIVNFCRFSLYRHERE